MLLDFDLPPTRAISLLAPQRVGNAPDPLFVLGPMK